MENTIVLIILLLAAIGAGIGVFQSPRSGGAWGLFLFVLAVLVAVVFGAGILNLGK